MPVEKRRNRCCRLEPNQPRARSTRADAVGGDMFTTLVWLSTVVAAYTLVWRWEMAFVLFVAAVTVVVYVRSWRHRA